MQVCYKTKHNQENLLLKFDFTELDKAEKKIQSVRRKILPRNVNDYSVRPGCKSQPGLTVSGLTDGCLKLSIMLNQLLINKSLKKIQSVGRSVGLGYGSRSGPSSV
jgi:hypothetical protein